MGELTFTVEGSRTAPFAVSPTIDLELRIRDSDPQPIQSVQLQAQIRIEPERRSYTADEERLLLGLFGIPERWGDTLQPFQWTHVTLPVGGFHGSTLVHLPIECSYDLEVIIGQYLHALADGEVPLILLFSGTVFRRLERGLTIEQIPWQCEARYRLPVDVWRTTMDTAFPDSGWLRLRRETLDRLVAYKAVQATPTFDAAIGRLLSEAEVSP